MQRFIICEKCGKKIPDIGYYEHSATYKTMIRLSLCYECAYWNNISENIKDTYICIDGILYDVMPYCTPKPNVTLGMDGKECYILKENGETVFSNDVWKIGKVPLKFCDNFKKGWWMTAEAFNIIKKRKIPCRNKYCNDRYRCFFYEWWKESEMHAIPKIPLNWISGDSMCKFFLNRSMIRNYDNDVRKVIQNSF